MPFRNRLNNIFYSHNYTIPSRFLLAIKLYRQVMLDANTVDANLPRFSAQISQTVSVPLTLAHWESTKVIRLMYECLGPRKLKTQLYNRSNVGVIAVKDFIMKRIFILQSEIRWDWKFGHVT